MLTDDGKHLYVSWDEYHMLIERLALKIHASGWQFDQILCLARGGMRPGDVLSRAKRACGLSRLPGKPAGGKA
jgi:hypoxanthine phosphoribosyltransferase